VAALIFAAGHLPVVVSQLELTLAIAARTLLLNTLAGLLFGWLFWRHNLEAAMVAHASTHLGFAGWRLLTG
jgi:ABC-type sulfate transport system permease component